ncbi:MAG: NUDIX domain-containing protein [Candidatus Micrarchaeia archaeon]
MNDASREVFKLYATARSLKFTEIERALGTKSNKLAYNLKLLQTEGVLRKQGERYCLTAKGESLLPFIKQLEQREAIVVPVVVVLVTRGKRVLLLKRAKRPFRGYWCFVGGKMRLGESVAENALREAAEETGLHGLKYVGLKAIVHERITEHRECKHAFLLLFTHVKSERGEPVSGEEGEVVWFPLDALPKKMIPSDRALFERFRSGRAKIHEAVISESNGRVGKLKLS